MSAWLLQRPPSINDKHERFLIRVDDDQPETTPQPLLALRFVTSRAADAGHGGRQGRGQRGSRGPVRGRPIVVRNILGPSGEYIWG